MTTTSAAGAEDHVCQLQREVAMSDDANLTGCQVRK